MNKTPVTPAKPASGKKTLIIRGLIAAAVLLAAYFIYQNYRYEGTDDAYVQAHALMLAPRIGGVVVKVLVKENQKVKAGEVLAQLDDEDYSTSYSQAVADQASVEADVEQAAQDYQRYTKLYQDQAISKSDYDAALAKYRNLSSRMKSDQAKADQAKLNLSY